MQTPAIISNHKGMLKGLIGAVLIIALGFYLVYIFKQDTSATVTQAGTNQALLGQNFALFLQAVTQDKISFRNVSFLNSYHLRNAIDFTQDIPASTVRGREDPFSPYAASRPSR